MAKKKDVVPVFVDNVEALEAKMQAMREAQKIFATYTPKRFRAKRTKMPASWRAVSWSISVKWI